MKQISDTDLKRLIDRFRPSSLAVNVSPLDRQQTYDALLELLDLRGQAPAQLGTVSEMIDKLTRKPGSQSAIDAAAWARKAMAQLGWRGIDLGDEDTGER